MTVTLTHEHKVKLLQAIKESQCDDEMVAFRLRIRTDEYKNEEFERFKRHSEQAKRSLGYMQAK